jgi:uncharacterized protein
MLTRTIMIAALVWLAWWLYRRARVEKSPPASAAVMRQCAHCGLHLPADEAVSGSQAYFCSVAHKDAHESRHP